MATSAPPAPAASVAGADGTDDDGRSSTAMAATTSAAAAAVAHKAKMKMMTQKAAALTMADYNDIRALGHGAFAVARLVRRKATGQHGASITVHASSLSPLLHSPPKQATCVL